MIVIGITGGIASGKSTIARMFAQAGFVHVDADALVHELMQEPQVVDVLSDGFPSAIIAGKVDRKRLGEIVGADAYALRALEEILHPLVRDAELAAIAHAAHEGRRGVILDIPLLFESGAEALCDKVIAVTAPLEIRRARAFERPNMTEEKFARLVARQWTDDARNAKADWVIPTDRGLAFTQQQVDAILEQLAHA